MAVTETAMSLALNAPVMVQNCPAPIPSGGVTQFREYKFLYSDFTDGGGAAATLTLPMKLPAGTILRGMAGFVITGFTADTTAVLIVGDGTGNGDTFCDDAGAVSVYTTGTYVAFDPARNAVNHADYVSALTAATSVVLTITGTADWGNVVAGEMIFRVMYDYVPFLA